MIQHSLIIMAKVFQFEKTNLRKICLVQICCKCEICKALQPVQRWQWPNLHKNGQIRPLPHLHWLQSFANFIFATYLHQANLGQIQFFIPSLLAVPISRGSRWNVPGAIVLGLNVDMFSIRFVDSVNFILTRPANFSKIFGIEELGFFIFSTRRKLEL